MMDEWMDGLMDEWMDAPGAPGAPPQKRDDLAKMTPRNVKTGLHDGGAAKPFR